MSSIFIGPNVGGGTGSNPFNQNLNTSDSPEFAAVTVGGVAVAGAVAAGYKIARVEMALDGGNPTSWATGLTTIVSATVTLKGTGAPGVGTSVLTANINGTSLDVYAWKVTATDDCTLIASTGTEHFYGIAVGT